MKANADIVAVGLAVMGEKLIPSMESKGFTVAGFNRTTSKVDDFIKCRYIHDITPHFSRHWGLAEEEIQVVCQEYSGPILI